MECLVDELICMLDSLSITISKIEKNIIFVLLSKNHIKQTHYLTFASNRPCKVKTTIVLIHFKSPQLHSYGDFLYMCNSISL